MLNKLLPLILLSISCSTFSKESSGLKVGLGIVGKTHQYIGEDTDFLPFPLISYEGERFFLRGLYGGVNVYKNEKISLNVITSVNPYKLNVDDLDSSKLAQRNLTKSQLEDRKMSADAGLEAILKVPHGRVSMQAVNDLGWASEGAKLKLDYIYFWNIHPKLTLMPTLGAEWLSDKRANYYYGTLSEEVAKGVQNYKPNSAVIPHIALATSYNISKEWQITSGVSHKFLPNKLSNSPLMDKDSVTSFYIGATYKF